MADECIHDWQLLFVRSDGTEEKRCSKCGDILFFNANLGKWELESESSQKSDREAKREIENLMKRIKKGVIE